MKRSTKGILNKMLVIVVGLILIVGLFYAGCFVVGMTLFAEASFGARKKTYSDIENLQHHYSSLFC